MWSLVWWYNLVASSILMCMGVIPVITQRASLDIVRYAFAILIFINHCTLVILFSYFSFFIALLHTGAPYKRRGKIPPTYIVLNALWPIPSWSLLILHLQILISCISLLCSFIIPIIIIIILKYFNFCTWGMVVLFIYTLTFCSIFSVSSAALLLIFLHSILFYCPSPTPQFF